MVPRLLVPALLVLTACGGDAAGAFCGSLGKEPSCNQETAGKCQTAISEGKAADAVCAPFIDKLVSCGSSLKLSCTGTSSISIVGDGMFNGGQNFTDIGGNRVVVNDSKCDVYRRGLEACRTCPTAAGAKEPEALGIGDSCGPSITPACATGLTCNGICTRSCTKDSECEARADGCKLSFQYPNVCSAGKCTLSCGSVFTCTVKVGDASRCEKGACTLP